MSCRSRRSSSATRATSPAPWRSSRRPSRPSEHGDAHGLLAKLYVDLAEPDRAIFHAKKVVELEPDDTFSYVALSMIYVKCGKIPEAEHAKRSPSTSNGPD